MGNGHFFSKLRRNIKSLVVKYFPNLIGNQCLFKILHTSSTEATRKDAEKVNVSKISAMESAIVNVYQKMLRYKALF